MSARSKLTLPSHLETSASEVRIRTMASDIELLGKSGGLLPRRMPISVLVPSVAISLPTKEKSSSLMILVVIFASAIVLFLLGFFILPALFTKKSTLPTSQNNSPITSGNLPSVPVVLSENNSAVPGTHFAHVSFFKNPSTDVPLFVFSTATTTPSPDQYKIFLKNLPTNLIFSEIQIQKEDSSQPSWNEFLLLANANLLTPGFWKDNFEPDFTAFSYKDKNGIWPGYILKLKEGKTLFLLQNEILKLESNPVALGNLFAVAQNASTTIFRDNQILGQPVRTTAFGTKGAVISYGWFLKNYFVISTSEDGFRQAVGNP